MITPLKLIILLVIIMIVFGTGKLRNVGKDLGEAIRGFRNALKEGETEGEKVAESDDKDKVIEGEAIKTNEKV